MSERVRLVDILTQPPAEALAAFVREWHGIELAAAPTPGRLPVAVRQLIDAQRATEQLFVQNWLELEPDGGRLSDHGRRAIYIENQNNHEWAIDDDAPDDAPVWVNLDMDFPRWTLEAEPLSTFLLQVIVFEALMGAMGAGLPGPPPVPDPRRSYARSREVAGDELAGLTAGLQLLPWAPWRWPTEHYWFYAGARVVAVVTSRGSAQRGPSNRFRVEVASHLPDGLDELAVGPQDGPHWETWRPGLTMPLGSRAPLGPSPAG